MLDIDDVLGKRIVQTRLGRNVTIREENAIAALEVMGRFAVDPKWLVYLPPAISPSETSNDAELLEHPAEAFAYYRHEGVPRVVCEEKHMGSRAVVVVCLDEDAAHRRFGVTDGSFGDPATRAPGRRFLDDDALEAALLTRVRDAAQATGSATSSRASGWCLDCELMPWSAKAQELLRQQYAAVGAASQLGAGGDVAALTAAAARLDGELDDLRRAPGRVRTDAALFVDAYRRYCWPVTRSTT